MRKISMLAAGLGAAAIFAPAVIAADVPAVTPFPAPKVGQVFVAAQTVTADGVEASYFAPGSTVIFRAYAVDATTKKVLGKTDVSFFYAAIPGQPNLKFAYDAKAKGATPRLPWTASWVVPAAMTEGTVQFKVLVKTLSKHRGQFVQLPLATSQLTVSKTPPAPFTPAPAAPATTAFGSTMNVSLYVDSVNGTRPAGAAPRPIGCTQTNVYKRGEQLVVRAEGFDLGSGDVLSTDNIDTAFAQIPGQPNVTLNWGSHGGATGKVWYWTGAWAIPTDYALGETNIHVVYKTDEGKIGVYDYKVTIIP